MKKLFRILGIFVLSLVIIIGGIIVYIKTQLPNVGAAPNLQVELTQERIEHGRYLANSVTVCMDCHSTRDWTKYSGPVIAGTEGKGGERFDQTMGFPGVYYSKNITPSGIKRYTDGELYRLITTGVTKEGRAMFPVMPYPYYSHMDDDDIYSIIAYLRTLKPIENSVAESTPDFPLTILLNTMPKKNTHSKRPDKSDVLAYGSYMINAAACKECHSPADKGQINNALAFSGGREFNFPDGSIVRSANITPDEETGIGRWTNESFLKRFKLHSDSAYVAPTVNEGEFNTVMPWTMYATMKDEDLNAIYVYLRSIKPIANNVVKFTPSPNDKLSSR